MRLLNINGKLVTKNVTRYLIKWDKECKSKLQFKVKKFLRPFWRPFIVYEEFPVYGTLLKVDILNASLKVAIEVQGPQHNEFHYFHDGKPELFLDSVKRDCKKMEWLERNGFQLIEIMYNEVDTLSKEWFRQKFNLIL